VEKMKKRANVMMNRRLKCPCGKSEETFKCDDESLFEMPAWKKCKMLKCDDESPFKMPAWKK